jgi:hypothetical protein
VLFAYGDDTLHDGWSRPIGGRPDGSGEATTGGESSHRMFDVDGDNDLELIEATSSGELHVLRDDGTPLPSFNGGRPVRTQPYPNVHPRAPAYGSVEPPRESLRIPAIGDIDGDLEPEIVDTAGEHAYAWEMDGSAVDGFPVRLDPALSAVPLRTRENHIKRGFVASPTLGDLSGDAALEIVAPALDQHVYAWDGDGDPLAGFPARLRERDGGGPIPCSGAFECAEIINTAAVGDIAGDSTQEIVVPTAEFDDNPSAPEPPAGLGGFGGILTNVLANALGGSGRVYALDARGDVLPGWPTTPNGIVPDALPFVGPGVDHVLGNVDGDLKLEAIGGLATGEVTATNGDGSRSVDYDSEPPGGEHVDKSKVLNLFENPIVANLDGAAGLEVLKGGITLNGLVNVGVAVGQNLPFNHVLQGWNGESGLSMASFPQAVEDFQLLSSPAVADVSNAPGREAIVGTGLYLIRNISATGMEGTGWPKFTGGWNFAVPAVGDVDDDGKLEVSAMSREGFSFLWDTGSDACAASDGPTNSEWWTSRHDEWSTGAYGTDARPPGTPEGLAATRDADTVAVRWTAPGDDWLCGEAERIRLVAAEGPIEHPSQGAVVREEDAQAGPGEEVELELDAEDLGDATHMAVLYRDDAGNWGHLASAEIAPEGGAGPGGGAPGEAGGGASTEGRCANRVSGTGARDRLTGSVSGDHIRGRGGRDRIKGGDGDDCLRGGASRDRVSGEGGADDVKGNRGRDRLQGGGGVDVLGGGRGRDRIRVRDGEADVVRCGKGRDRALADAADKLRGCERVRKR